MINIKKIFLISIPILIIFDQLSKQWALENIFNTQQIIEINSFFNLVPVWNKGISFGLLSNIVDINFFMIIITTIISMLSLSLALIISGAIGNLIDRFRHEAVVDFIDIHISNYHWPAFNFADSYITIGAFLYIYTIFTSQKENIA